MMSLTVISLFTGAMGLDLGFEHEGFQLRVALEKDPRAVETVERSRVQCGLSVVPILSDDIHCVSTRSVLDAAGLDRGEATVVTGAPPCEPFSTAGRRNGFHDSRADGVYEFIRVVEEAKPRFFVFEEVPGFVRSAKRHISFYDRVKRRPEELAPAERLGSAFEEVMVAFRSSGYSLSFGLLNAADFGVPQKRKRFVLIGAREGCPVPVPEPTHGHPASREVIDGSRKSWATLRDALTALHDPQPEYLNFPPSWRHYLEYVPPGGCWKCLPKELQREALGGAYDDPKNPRTRGLKGGRTGFLRRLSWDKPAPTLVDRPTTRAGCICHPDLLRPLSVKEYARLQGFPDNWVFCGTTSDKYRLIGQATPVPLALAIARVIRAAYRGPSEYQPSSRPRSRTW